MKRRLLTMAIATLSALYASAQVTSVYDVAGSVGTYNEITGGTVLTGLPAEMIPPSFSTSNPLSDR